MVAKKCVHPIKVNRIITQFANDIAVLPVSKYFEVEFKDGSVQDCFELPTDCEIVNYTAHETEHYFTVKANDDNTMMFSVECVDYEEEAVQINVPKWRIATYNDDVPGKCFRKDFVSRCPMARGFADVTISVLHEIGHRMTDALVPDDYDREEREIEIDRMTETTEEMNALYFQMPDEILATNWAIEWLADAENRKKAKAFEKKFFACFK